MNILNSPPRNKRLIRAFFLLLLIGLHACLQDSKTIPPTNQKSTIKVAEFNKFALRVSQQFEDYTLFFEVKNSGSTTTSKLMVQDAQHDPVYNTSYRLDTAKAHYQFEQADSVVKKAKQIDDNLSMQQYATIDDNFITFMFNIFSKFSDKKIAYMLEPLYLHHAIINTKRRSIQQGDKICECTLHPGYIFGKMGFICQEDYMVPADILKTYINSDSLMSIQFDSDAQKEAFRKHVDNLLTHPSQQISFDKIQSFFLKKESFNSQVSLLRSTNYSVRFFCILGQGSAWGCCGNYEGCCWFWYWGCWLHDAACTDCAYEWCLDGCIPDNPQQADPQQEKDLLLPVKMDDHPLNLTDTMK